MKKFWLVLLSLGLITAFSMSAMAVDVKFSGEYYATGMYLDKTSLNKDTYTYTTFVKDTLFPSAGHLTPYVAKTNTQAGNAGSTAFYFQRLRLNTTFVVSPGLMLITRADIMERAWGSSRSTPVGGEKAYDTTLSSGTRAENENIAFDLAYVSYTSPIGIFTAGYQIDGAWGTVFGDNSNPAPKIGYIVKVGNVTAGLQTGKNPDGENSYGAFEGDDPTGLDRDNNFYTGFARYSWKGGEAGFLIKHIRNAANRNVFDPLAAVDPRLAGTGFAQKVTAFLPYVKAQLGPVSLQAEAIYATGKIDWEGRPDLIPGPAFGGINPQEDQDVDNLAAWIDAVADFGMIYVGGTAAYISGDNPSTTDKVEGGVANGGFDWNPCLIMFNYDRTYWVGPLAGYGAGALGTPVTNNSPMTNAWFGQLRGGIRPVEKLDVMASVSYAKADKDPVAGDWAGKEYGWEVDLTGTYKITNNLSYMLGAAYFFTGDYYKATNEANEVDDNFMVINKLTLTF